MQAVPRSNKNPFGTGLRRDLDADEDDLDASIRETLNVQEESANTSSAALQKAREAENLAASNLNKLNAQGEQLDRVHNNLDTAGSHIATADSKTNFLTKLNRSFLIPVFGKEADPVYKPPPTSSTSSSESPYPAFQAKMGPDGKPLWAPRGSSLPHGGFPGFPGTERSAPPARSMVGDYGAQEDQDRSAALEARIDSDLNGISDAMRNIHAMAGQMSYTIDKQNAVIEDIDTKVDYNQERLHGVNKKLDRIMKS
ncbi:hypothetical protein BDK51DRAFT_46422 [Blyttiomyces helicus]|uniref:t-SNARE coiled-coil homology domain-containing protein n=1 Tax=Blyttiomyces helicus TaxID=388810 RepID=A0A4P9WD43_9FUNG|nr:hypothetical protein BDK51DRAFT_46422 [Blyttiomyces helicus]|eukprot:RKO90444.1 hypothetical protein BDK51DRAFT_46422 [Blyttiomyces helicus]